VDSSYTEAEAAERWRQMTPDPSSRTNTAALAVSASIAFVTVAALLYLTVADGADKLDIGGRVTSIVALVGLSYAISTFARLKVQSHIAKSRFSEAWIELQEAIAAVLPIAAYRNEALPGDSDPYLTACLRAGVLETSDIWILRFWRDRIMDKRVRVSASVVDEVAKTLESAIGKVYSFGNRGSQ